MTPYERIARALADHFDLDVVVLLRAGAFQEGVDRALAIMGEKDVIGFVVDQGTLRGAVRPYGVIIARVQALAGQHEYRLRLAAEEADAFRLRVVDDAARQGETYAHLVEADSMFPDEARQRLVAAFADEDLRAMALAAFDGRIR